MAGAKYVIKGSTGKFRFNLHSTNGKVIATSAAYRTKRACLARKLTASPVAALATLVLTAAASASSIITLHPGQSRVVGHVHVVCTTHKFAMSATRIVLHPGHQARIGKVRVRCVAAVTITPSPKPAPTPEPTPEPTPTPTPSPLTPGSYKGATQDGNFVYFTVQSDRTIQGWRTNDLGETCDGPLTIYGVLDVGLTPVPLTDDGHFTMDYSGSGTVGDQPANFHTHVDGVISGAVGSGTAQLASEFDYNGRHWHCSSPRVSWTAALQP